jgi:hypothetical protein
MAQPLGLRPRVIQHCHAFLFRPSSERTQQTFPLCPENLNLDIILLNSRLPVKHLGKEFRIGTLRATGWGVENAVPSFFQ